MQKKAMVQIIKHKFLNTPTVAAIGDCFHDTLMMQASHCSFELKQVNTIGKSTLGKSKLSRLEESEVIVCNSGDVMVTSFADI
jgi:magnesium-transporting ATPase (P-type)